MGIVSENMTPSTELPRDFCAGIGPLQLGVVLVFLSFDFHRPVVQGSYAGAHKWLTNPFISDFLPTRTAGNNKNINKNNNQ